MKSKNEPCQLTMDGVPDQESIYSVKVNTWFRID